MIRATPFLLFDGNCAEAMQFYQHCLGGDLSLLKTGDTPMKDQFPVEKHGRIIHAQLKSGAIEISATDWMASPMLDPKPGNTTAIYVVSETQPELKEVFDKLAEGADMDQRTFMELRPVPFGVYGQLTDKFGVSWIFRGESE